MKAGKSRTMNSQDKRNPAIGPLRQHPDNPRYFTDGSKRAIYLTGSHTWANFQDQGAQDPPPIFDYNRYLDWMVSLNHNFIRLWVWEQARWAPWADAQKGRPADWFISPAWAYPRSGPGLALDGKPKFDLGRFDQAYFDRLRERVSKAGERGIYVSIMLFQGWSSYKPWYGGRPWLGHPYHPSNNIQGFNGNPSSDSGPDLDYQPVRELQVAYLHELIDTVNDLDNTLYEVTNEGGNKDWDWYIIDQIHAYEKTKPKQHPAGITGHGAESNAEMLGSPADWFSPGSDPWPDLKTDPRPTDGKKVALLDTDHVFGTGGDQQWVWKAFLRGYNVLFMDPYNDIEWDPILTPYHPSRSDQEQARHAMGVTRAYADRINLVEATPRPELASTSYCLAVTGKQYLVYLPEGGQISVDLSGAGNLAVEWVHPVTGVITTAGMVTGGGLREFSAPFGGEALLFLYSSK
jgi:hypothetical protein